MKITKYNFLWWCVCGGEGGDGRAGTSVLSLSGGSKLSIQV